MPTYAIDSGKSIHYESHEDANGTRMFSVTVDGIEYVGVCAEIGVHAAREGDATVTKISNNSRYAKMMYKFGVEMGWFDGEDAEKPAAVIGAQNTKYRGLLTHISQLMVQDRSTWVANGIANAGMASSFANTVANWVEAQDVSDVQVPSWFECYTARCSDQDFTLFILEQRTGKLKLKKASSNTDMTG